MSAVQTAFERRDAAKSTRAAWVFAAKVLFALALVLTATFALVRTEVMSADPQQLGNPAPILMLQ
jgi:hypothetical protein